VHTGNKAIGSVCGLYPVCAWKIGDEPMEYMAEGQNNDNGTVIKWAVSAGLVSTPEETEKLAQSVPESTSNDLFFIPAFNGLQAPVKDSQAAAGFIGLLPDMRPAHMVRAILDSISYRNYQLCDVLKKEARGFQLQKSIKYVFIHSLCGQLLIY
jgi:putative glycerol kinase 5